MYAVTEHNIIRSARAVPKIYICLQLSISINSPKLKIKKDALNFQKIITFPESASNQ